ncbi:MAG: mechanosensitive ion channel family protein [Sphingobium sp.]|nr:mechanosensitive ion channel family protein [Sphingobium sp.]
MQASNIPVWVADGLVIVIAVALALTIHWIVLKLGRRWAKRSRTPVDDMMIARLSGPARWLLIAFALAAIGPNLHLSGEAATIWARIAGLLVPALIGWMLIALLGLGYDVVRARADITAADNLRARSMQTRANIFYRIGLFIILVATFCLMLMSIPAVRDVGVTLIASAGLAALAVGAAAQPALKNLIGGLQMAFTEPIRIDDVVIMDNEWGRIEEIRLTYVVVKLWDERRLVVPVSKFLEQSFQNWTRETSQILGSVFWYVDPACDMARLRAKVHEVIEANGKWDRRFRNMQVTDSKAEAIEVRALMTAKDASTAFDLRCDVREAVLQFLREEMPEAIVRQRTLFEMVEARQPVM